MSTTLHRIADSIAAEVYAQVEEISPDTERIFADLDEFDRVVAYAVAEDLGATIAAAVQQRVADWYAARVDRSFDEIAADLVSEALVSILSADRIDNPGRWAEVSTFSDLHDHVDANEFVDEAFASVGLLTEGRSQADYSDQRWLDIANRATDVADRAIRSWAGVR